uniref:Putative co-chaperone protein hscb mitochondrial n=1 Tax=Culex tarsalis TaxID=7177 RepID=A0A1Q3FB95_CULTA
MLRSRISNMVQQLARKQNSARAYCSITSVCWSCNKPLVKTDKFFCASCGSLQKVEQENYFQLLDMPCTFDINPVKLTSNFRQLQAVLHPDKFSQKPEAEKILSLEWSSLVNKAYKTLNVPIERGKYLLQQSGIEIGEANTSVDSQFLLEMMERNESVEEAESLAELEELAGSLKTDIDRLYQELQQHFAEKSLDEAKMTLVRLKYLLNIVSIVNEKLLKLKLQ